MRYQYMISSGAVALFLSLSCQTYPAQENHNNGGIQLVVVDSVGIDYGNDFEVFGNISGALFINDSTFIVLDKGYQELRLFDRGCNHISTVYNQGNGPLEYQFAEHLASVDSKFAVFEFYMPPRCVVFDHSTIPIQSTTLNESTALDEPCFVNDTIIAGCIFSISQQNVNGTPIIECEICTWDVYTGERLQILYKNSYELTTIEDGYSRFVKLENSVSASSSDRVFIAPDKSDYQILVFSSDGNVLDTLYTRHEQALREAAEIKQELDWRLHRDRNLGNWEPSQYELGITQLQVQDSLGLLWVSHGSYFNPHLTYMTCPEN